MDNDHCEEKSVYMSSGTEVFAIIYPKKKIVIISVSYTEDNPKLTLVETTQSHVKKAIFDYENTYPDYRIRVYVDMTSIMFLSGDCIKSTTSFGESMEASNSRVDKSSVVLKKTYKLFGSVVKSFNKYDDKVTVYSDPKTAWSNLLK